MTDTATLRLFTDALLDAVAAGHFVSCTISKPTPTAGDLKSIDIRPILIKRALKLSFTYHHRTRDVVKNYAPQDAAELITEQLLEHFRSGYLTTTQGDLQLSFGNGYKINKHAARSTKAPELLHDRAKQRPIESANKPYLYALGITDAKGVVLKTAQDKFRQINKYIEILDGLLKPLPNKKLRIVDMGAGKGYLTFALYDHLANNLKRDAEIIGVEMRAELVKQCNDIAQNAGFNGLTFKEGSIDAYDCTGADVVIALHACDTATDDAISKAVKAQASLIVVAPCCHKQIRRAMKQSPEGLKFLTRFGTYEERLAEMVTDGLRVQLLEQSNYKTNLFEFISDVHTPKNVMIVATRSTSPLAPNDAEKIAKRIAATKSEFGIEAHALEGLLKF